MLDSQLKEKIKNTYKILKKIKSKALKQKWKYTIIKTS